MPDLDAHPELEHPEVTGWVLGALDPDEAESFQEHLRSCGECQAAVAAFEPVARMLQTAAPAVQPPPDLQARTLASVERAANGTRRAARTSAWRWC